jgi:hypothetical protein
VDIPTANLPGGPESHLCSGIETGSKVRKQTSYYCYLKLSNTMTDTYFAGYRYGSKSFPAYPKVNIGIGKIRVRTGNEFGVLVPVLGK